MTSFLRILILSFSVVALNASAADGNTTLQATTLVTLDHDPHLNHAVKELGMSAKQVGQERRWRIGPQFLHATADIKGTFEVEFKKGDAETAVVVTAVWAGDPKPPAIQKELEERVRLVATKIAQTTGVSKPKVQCTLTAPGGKSSSC